MTQKISHDPLPLAAKASQPLHAKPKHTQADQAAEQFEIMMAQQMIKSMQSSLEGGSLFGGGVAGDIYSGLAEVQLAQTLTKGSHFGLKEQILRQLPKAEVQK
ncbi:MAG TPA: rod-binding protein [bacterium]|jgi:Rod binding domain-containing protein